MKTVEGVGLENMSPHVRHKCDRLNNRFTCRFTGRLPTLASNKYRDESAVTTTPRIFHQFHRPFCFKYPVCYILIHEHMLHIYPIKHVL